MIATRKSRYDLELTPQNFQDLRQIRDLIALENLRVNTVKSWRDTYHTQPRERILVRELVIPTGCQWVTPKKLKIEARTLSGARRVIGITIGDTFIIEGTKDWYTAHEFVPVIVDYYIGLDESELVYGTVVRQKFREEGTKYINLDNITLRELESVLTSKIPRDTNYNVHIYVNPELGVSPRGYQVKRLEGYARLGWQAIPPREVPIAEISRSLIEAKNRDRLVRGAITLEMESERIRNVYMTEDIDSSLFTRVVERFGDKKILVHDGAILPLRFYKEGLCATLFY